MGTYEIGITMEKYLREICTNVERVHKTPNIEISVKKMMGECDPLKMIFIYNAAIATGNKTSSWFAADAEYLYFRNIFEEGKRVRWKDICEVEICEKNKYNLIAKRNVIRIKSYKGSIYEMDDCLAGTDYQKVEEMIKSVSQVEMPDEFEKEYQFKQVSLEKLPDNLLILYMKILYNYAYLNGMKIDAQEYKALNSIGVRLGIGSGVRNELRNYMLYEDRRIKTGVLLKRMQSDVSYASFEIISYSLMQDIVYIREVTGTKEDWREDAFINSIQGFLGISDEQIKCMYKTVMLYQVMQKNEIEYIKQLENDMKVMYDWAKNLWIPREAICCFGSIYSMDKYILDLKKQKSIILQSVSQREDDWSKFEKDFMKIEFLGRTQMQCLCDVFEYLEVIRKVNDFINEEYVIEEHKFEAIKERICKDKDFLRSSKIGDAARFAAIGAFNAIKSGCRIGDEEGRHCFENAKKEEIIGLQISEMQMIIARLKEHVAGSSQCDELWEHAEKTGNLLRDIRTKTEKNYYVLKELPSGVRWKNLSVKEKRAYKSLYAAVATILSVSHIGILGIMGNHIIPNLDEWQILDDELQKLMKYLNSIEGDLSSTVEGAFAIIVDKTGNVSFQFCEGGKWNQLPDEDDINQTCKGTNYRNNINAITEYINRTYDEYTEVFFYGEDDEYMFLVEHIGKCKDKIRYCGK